MSEKQNKDSDGVLKRVAGFFLGRADDSNPDSKRILFAQLLYTALSFLALIVLTYIFVRGVIQKNLSRNAENVFSLVQIQVENDLNNPKMYLAGFSRTVRSSLMLGVNRVILEEFFNDLARHLLDDDLKLTGFEGLSGYFPNMPGGPVFIETFDWNLPDDYDPTTRPWYLNAVAAQGEIAQTTAYNDIIDNNNILIYSLCLHDDNGNFLGVVCMRLKLAPIGDKIVEATIDRGGWGMLITSDLIVLAHINEPFVGIDARSPWFPPHIYVPQMLKGENVFEGQMEDYLGNKSLTFFRPLSNGWYLGLVTPEGPFYQSLTTLAYILGILGVIFAAILMAILISIDMAKNKSDRESRHKSAFLANMSHEIRTPMNAIIGMTTIGKNADNIERKDYCFSKIEDASNHLLGVINDILDMSKIEANKFELLNEEFNFEKMLQRVVNVVNFRVDEKHHRFTVHIDKKIPKYLIGDDQRVAQVITNLLGNAIKFTPEKGSITLNAKLLGEENDLYTIQFSVIDTGIGLNEEQKRRIFLSFEQAESTTTRKYGGTGLGLAISKNIVELMDGRIWVESEPNKGSNFMFTIKVKRSSRIHEGLLDAGVNLSNIRIMAVDDDKDILDYFNEIAEGFGVACCDVAISGEAALGLVAQNGEYHIYFVDWKMPVMDGIQLAAELKRRASAKSVVIMITAAEWTSVEAEAKEAGVDKFLSKPLFPSMIMDVIIECISHDRQQMETAHKNIKGIFAERYILLAEDVEINQEIVIALLEPTQIKIDCAINGAEAVRLFKEAPERYDMILMDVQMPEMDGYEATKKIRALDVPQAKTVKIIAMTANVFRDDIEKCQEVGMDSHIGKPLNFDEVVEKLLTFMPSGK
ncbi:MAG: response regulator [Treponema sp.]|jgi:signal transduction histidine kinase/CheY-like chemotaxis protein|nr:response regulator [Treponema sp.]